MKTVHELEQGKLYTVHKGMSGRDLKFHIFLGGYFEDIMINPDSVLLFLEMEYEREIDGRHMMYPYKLSFLYNNQIIFNVFQERIELDSESRFSVFKLDVFVNNKKISSGNH